MTANGYFTRENSAETVIARMKDCPDARLVQVMSALIRHLHAAVDEVGLTMKEWEAAIAFLTKTGHTCTEWRQEFILLSDILGASMLVDAINHDRGGGTTESTVLGPFHVAQAPMRAMGDDICLDHVGSPIVVHGKVLDPDGKPIAGALLDVWQANGDGFYDVQQAGIQPPMNLRGRFTTGADGRFWFKTIEPRFYPIPDDGPVGKLLRAMGRHPFRPAHIHFIVEAPGFEKLTTHLFPRGAEYLDSDAVFGVKDSLIADLAPADDPTLAAACRIANPFTAMEWEFRLSREAR